MKIDVSFTMDMPVEANSDEVLAWLRYKLGATGSMEADNPLEDYDIEARPLSVDLKTRRR